MSGPGPTVHIESHGCAFNASDGEVMAALLERAGFRLVEEPGQADAVIINSCTVKDQTIRDLRRRLAPHLAGRSEGGPAVILTGCVPRVPEHAREFAALSQIGPDQIGAIPEVVRQVIAGERATRTSRHADAPRLTLPHRRQNPAVEILPINKGCLGACSFCQTVLARGRLVSFPEEQIVARIERAVSEGVRIVWLTSQDCGAYGKDRRTSLPELLRRIAGIPGDFRVRVGMANPDHVKEFAGELGAILAGPRFFRFAHIPVQSGSDGVLRDMKRLYTASEFREIVGALRAAAPDITIATDLIVGYPTEAPGDFEESLRLVEELEIPVLHRSKFSPRPGTPAARLRPLAGREVSARSRRLYEAHRRLAQRLLSAHVGRPLGCVPESPLRDGLALWRSTTYLPVIAPAPVAFDVPRIHVPDEVSAFHLRAPCTTHGPRAQ